MKRPLLAALLAFPFVLPAADAPKEDPRYPFRTDFANENLPWYQLQPLEFPPHHSDHRVGGELVEADYIHRSGVFRVNRTGELVHFKLPPFGTVYYLNAEADLRDVPLGTGYLFFLHQDAQGVFNQVATMQENFTMDASHGFTYRLDESKLAEGKLLVTKHSVSKNQPDLGHSEWPVNAKTRVWKGGQQVKLEDLAAGDELLNNRTGNTATTGPGVCTDIWAGVEAHQQATADEHKRHATFLKERGLPAWINAVEGNKLTVTLFAADRAAMQQFFKDEGIDPAVLSKEHRGLQAVVANEDLRTYNPPVDKQASTVVETRKVPTECYGCSGEQWVIEPHLLLEGFRKGHIVRLFVNPAWKIEDMPFGEGLYTEVPDVELREPELQQYPFRTDYGNAQLPWYSLQPGKFPPSLSEHRVSGELLKLDAAHRSGQFRADDTGEVVDFTLPPFGGVRYLNTEAELTDLPIGTRCFFYLHPDARGAFTQASLITDEFTRMAGNKVSYRLDEIRLDEGRLIVGSQLTLVKNYHGDMIRPPDIGRTQLAIDEHTRVWKAGQQVKLTDLAAGDELLVNTTGRSKTDCGHCTDIWIGAETQDQATDQQRKKYQALLKDRGFPGWIDKAEGNRLTITLFGTSRPEFTALMKTDPKGKPAYIVGADEQLHATAPSATKVQVVTRVPEEDSAGTYGCSGVRWLVDAPKLAETYHAGQIIRVFPGGEPTGAQLAESKPAEK